MTIVLLAFNENEYLGDKNFIWASREYFCECHFNTEYTIIREKDVFSKTDTNLWIQR